MIAMSCDSAAISFVWTSTLLARVYVTVPAPEVQVFDSRCRAPLKVSVLPELTSKTQPRGIWQVTVEGIVLSAVMLHVPGEKTRVTLTATDVVVTGKFKTTGNDDIRRS